MKELSIIVLCLLLLFSYEKGCVKQPIVNEAYELDKGYKLFLKHKFAHAVKKVFPLAQAGSANAQMFMGLMCEEGQGIARDYRTAKTWYLKSAEQGNTVSQYAIGLLYFKGLAVPKSRNAARKWLGLAAEGGHEGARYRLGLLDMEFKNDRERIEHYRAGAEGGSAEAQYLLGKRLREGHGIQEDKEEARTWLGKAVEQGHMKAMQELAWLESNLKPIAPKSPILERSDLAKKAPATMKRGNAAKAKANAKAKAKAKAAQRRKLNKNKAKKPR